MKTAPLWANLADVTCIAPREPNSVAIETRKFLNVARGGRPRGKPRRNVAAPEAMPFTLWIQFGVQILQPKDEVILLTSGYSFRNGQSHRSEIRLVRARDGAVFCDVG